MALTVRYSRQREAILNMLKNTKEHPTAEAVYMRIRRQIPNISLGTVYRNLSFLVEAGKLVKIQSNDDMLHFDAMTSAHYHLQCKACGRIMDVDMPISAGIDEQAADATGAIIDSHSICFYGICKDCCAKQGQGAGDSGGGSASDGDSGNNAIGGNSRGDIGGSGNSGGNSRGSSRGDGGNSGDSGGNSRGGGSGGSGNGGAGGSGRGGTRE
ncbi:MAG: transcriptional repressor [Clostridiales bacterium]|jgi:Fur family peroxide stress response transcriptional regulator|nr:transcriptional repressor [Clostridiales bacterium]